jgi:Tol biopolymer transport system component/DNA-binding winged helix-turn-helix (wHTH) protein
LTGNVGNVAFPKETGLSNPEPHSAERAARQYRFGDFTLDMEAGFLRRGIEQVKLRPKPLEVLAYLVEHHGRVVTKHTLIKSIWPDAAITDNSLAQCLVEIRRALDDDSQQSIRTVARRGYVFTAPVTTTLVEFPRLSGEPALPVPLRPAVGIPLNSRIIIAAFALLAITVGGVFLMRRKPRAAPDLAYTQITSFTDSAVAPALSPDGRMVAFFRSGDWFLTPDQIYVKLLPAGEPVQITHDPRIKYGLAFSPDGSRIAYTALEPGPLRWNTLTVSPLGGEPQLFLSNAAGLTWLDERRLLFSEITTGTHMGVVTATGNRSEYRRIYLPQHERAMAHFSYASPDRKWALVAEMDPTWQACRLIPLDGSSAGRQVGPQGQCTSAAWSPDGKWMYFAADVEGNHHLWRQRFQNGVPEQITFGATEEDGLAVVPDGRSVITSVGIRESAVWIHDRRGERPLSSEGYAAPMHVFPYSSAKFSPDGRLLFYLLRRESAASASELWRTDLDSGKSEPVLRQLSMVDYDLSSDGRELLFSTQPPGKSSQLWLAALDRSSPPKLIASTGEGWPRFGPNGQVLFQWSQEKANYLYRMKKDGSDRSRVVPYAVGNIEGTSPDGRWIVVGTSSGVCGNGSLMALSTDGKAARCICQEPCMATWAPDGRFLYIGVEPRSRTSPGKTVAIPVPHGEVLPRLPVSGIRTLNDAASLPGARLIEGWDISPGPDPSVFAFTKTTMHRNLFQIPLRDR